MPHLPEYPPFFLMYWTGNIEVQGYLVYIFKLICRPLGQHFTEGKERIKVHYIFFFAETGIFTLKYLKNLRQSDKVIIAIVNRLQFQINHKLTASNTHFI